MEKKTFTIMYLLSHTISWFIVTDLRWSFPDGIRFVFMKTVPALLFISLYYRKEICKCLEMESLRELAYVLKTCMLSLAFALGCYMMVFQKDLGIAGINWTWYAITTWCFAFVAFYFLLRKKFNGYESIVLSLLLCKLGGFLYELPVYPFLDPYVGIYFHVSHPFLIAFDWFLIPLLILYLRKSYVFNVKLHTFPTMLLFINFSMFYHWYRLVPLLPFHIHRIPAIILLGSVILSIAKKR